MNATAENINVRDIIEIDENLCNGCGQCISGCAEGALALVDGKAKLVSDIYCDGLGACLGHCPTGALKVIKRQAPEFDEEAVNERLRLNPAETSEHRSDGVRPPRGADRSRVRMMQVEAGGCPGSGARTLPMRPAGGGCPGSQARTLDPGRPEPAASAPAADSGVEPGLSSWPIQLKLIPPAAPALDSPVLVLASDCSAFTGTEFHRTFLTSGHPLVMACPKLDEVEPYIEKMTAILKAHPMIEELRVPMMSVPCCGGLGYIAAQALKRSGRENDVRLRTWIVTPQGQVTEENIR